MDFMKGKGKGMPGSQPGTPPMPGTMGPSFQTMAPMDFMKGKGKGMPPPSLPMSPRNTPPGSFRTMPPQQLNPELFPNFNSQFPQNRPEVKYARLGDDFDGRDVTHLVNQLVHSNGLADPTKGSSIRELFNDDQVLKVWGFGVPQKEEGGGTFVKDVPMVFQAGSAPPYDLRPLFAKMQTPGTMRAPPPVPVVAVIDLQKILDIPAPPSGCNDEVVLTLTRVQGGKQLARAGPFTAEPQGPGGLRNVNIKGKLAARVMMQDLAKGSVDFCISVAYQGAWYKFGSDKLVGVTVPFEVSWKPQTEKYVALMASPEPGSMEAPRPTGGIYISYRFAEDKEDLYKEVHGWRKAEGGAEKPAESNPNVMVNGMTGRFKKNSQDEVFEAAALAVEAQNRAFHQRINLAKSAKEMNEGRKANRLENSALVWWYDNNYRDWKDLDSLFVTMGPNYVAHSNELGSQICKVYEEDTSIWKELTAATGPSALGDPQSLEEEVDLKRMLSTVTNQDPDAVVGKLRPLICKDVKEIRHDGVRNASLKPKLKIRVHSATSLRSSDGFMSGKVHPKVICEIPGKPTAAWTSGYSVFGTKDNKGRWESSAAQDSKNVEWNEEGFIIDYDYGDDLKVMVVDKNWVGFDDHLGEARLSGSDFYPDSFFAQLPLSGGDKNMANTGRRGGVKGASILIEVQVIEPIGAGGAWPPDPPKYAPLENLNVSDQQTQRLANWDVHQNAKMVFADVNPNYKMGEDVWGSFETTKGLDEGQYLEKPIEWAMPRVKDDCPIA